jgi:hypothetical protein
METISTINKQIKAQYGDNATTIHNSWKDCYNELRKLYPARRKLFWLYGNAVMVRWAGCSYVVARIIQPSDNLSIQF